MGHHDEYGKRVLRLAFGSAFSDAAPPLCFPGGGRANIDGVIAGQIAVEVEARNHKQIRGAIMDLICHPLPKKLLVLIPANANEAMMVPQSKYLLNRFLEKECPFYVAVLKGKGNAETLGEDIPIIREAAKALGVLWKASDVENLTFTDYLPPQLRQPTIVHPAVVQQKDTN